MWTTICFLFSNRHTCLYRCILYLFIFPDVENTDAYGSFAMSNKQKWVYINVQVFDACTVQLVYCAYLNSFCTLWQKYNCFSRHIGQSEGLLGDICTILLRFVKCLCIFCPKRHLVCLFTLAVVKIAPPPRFTFENVLYFLCLHANGLFFNKEGSLVYVISFLQLKSVSTSISWHEKLFYVLAMKKRKKKMKDESNDSESSDSDDNEQGKRR